MPDGFHRALEQNGGGMTDSGLVLTTAGGLAEVEVACFEGCHECGARSLCIGSKKNTGRLSVKNPLHALPGDEVKIHIPESRYSQALIKLFGGLLACILLGMTGGGPIGIDFFPAGFCGRPHRAGCRAAFGRIHFGSEIQAKKQ